MGIDLSEQCTESGEIVRVCTSTNGACPAGPMLMGSFEGRCEGQDDCVSLQGTSAPEFVSAVEAAVSRVCEGRTECFCTAFQKNV